jgi:acetylornithine deacetylase/succinyl-diaminopimelate desuccinylase-like protein
MLDQATVSARVDTHWAAALPVLEEYIRIPAKSPAFDPDWAETGYLAAAVELIRRWCDQHAPDDASVWVHELEGLTPVIVIEVPASPEVVRADTVLLYGHLDKQPEMTGWREGLGPWTPVVENDRLYGRGGADDGYAAFAVTSALEALREAGGSHQRCVALIEASEESGSPDLPAHLDALTETLGDVSLVVCLDSSAPDYDALWVTTSLRGLIGAVLRVDVLDRGVHSGLAGGAAPSSTRIIRRLLDRIEDSETGRILLDSLHVDIPVDRLNEAEAAANAGVDVRRALPFTGSTRSDAESAAAALIDTTWRPAMATIGVEGIPSLSDAGNVLRPYTAVGLSFRIPPTCDPQLAIAELHRVIEADPPNGAQVSLSVVELASGWNATHTEPWLKAALDEASVANFGREAGWWGIGGSIPFMAMLGEQFPEAQFVITGVLGPESSAHGPNEFLDLPTARRISACVAHIVDAHARR